MLDVILKVVGGDAKSTEINLKLPTIIGRAKEATLTLPHPLVSRQHCELFEDDGLLHVKDLGSLNGTFVDNQRIEGSTVLNPEQLLTIGNVTFRAIYDYAKASSPSPEAIGAVNQHEERESASVNGAVHEDVDFVEEKADESEQVVFSDASEDSVADDVFIKKTEAGRSSAAAAQTSDVQSPNNVDGLETVFLPTENGSSNSDNGSSHSIVSALADVGEIKSDKSVSLSALAEIDVDGKSNTSSISSVNVLDDELPNQQRVGQSFLNVVSEEEIDKKISADESSLDSFIRKMPK